MAAAADVRDGRSVHAAVRDLPRPRWPGAAGHCDATTGVCRRYSSSLFVFFRSLAKRALCCTDLGSNDYGSGHIPTTDLWVKAYTQFVKNVSGTYRPSPQVFLTVSHCAGKNESEKYCADTKAAFESMKAAGLDNVHLLDITVNGTGAWDTPPGTIGCDRHPSQAAHALMGRIAAPKVKAAMGWKTDDTSVFRRAGTSPMKSVLYKPAGKGAQPGSIVRSFEDVRGQPYNVSFDERSLLMGNKRVMLLGGSFHYPRAPVEEWRTIMQAMKQDGLNHLQMYTCK